MLYKRRVPVESDLLPRIEQTTLAKCPEGFQAMLNNPLKLLNSENLNCSRSTQICN